MKKIQILLFIVSILIIGMLIVTCQQPSGSSGGGGGGGDGGSGIPPSSAKEITEFYFTTPAVTGTINEIDHKIAITVPFGTNISALAPIITHTGMSINPASGVTQNFNGKVNYTVTAADNSTQVYSVIVTIVEPNITKTITTLYFTSPAATGIINEINHTITVTLSTYTDKTVLVPTIIHTGASINPASGIAQNFTNPVTYTVTAEDGSTQDYVITVTDDPYNYSLRDTGPAGGFIFYINPNAATDGWKYLEAAPQSTEWILKEWGLYNKIIGMPTEISIGSGKMNTYFIVTTLDWNGESDRAAQLCNALTLNDYSDWFLPSPEELDKLYINLKRGLDENGIYYMPIGEFANEAYWSSYEVDKYKAGCQDFNLGLLGTDDKYNFNRVRAIRSF